MDRGVKLNNKGFTLIETIVAMTILVLVSVPIMDGISRGMKVSRDTSSYQRAVLLGQSVTEGIKAHSVDDLCKTFVYQNKYTFDILDKNVYTLINYGRMSTSNESDFIELPSNVDSSYGANDRKYYYGIYGVESGAKKYDVLVKLDSDEYNDINSKIIPSIVEVGSESTAVIDNTGLLSHTADRDLKDIAVENLVTMTGMSAAQIRNELRCKMVINIKKHNSSNGVTLGAYHVYGDVSYFANSQPSKVYTIENVGEDSFDYINKLKYLYVVCNSKYLVGTNEIEFNFEIGDLLSNGSDNVDIPVAIITSEGTTSKWEISVNGSQSRQYLQFFTNNGSDTNGMSNIYTTDGVSIDNFGDSGKKIRRIYGLTVQVYDYHENMSDKFKSKRLANIKSAFIR